MKTLTLLLCLLLLSFVGLAQSDHVKKPSTQVTVNQPFGINSLNPAWEKDLLFTGDTDGSRIVRDMAMDGDENVIVAGDGFVVPVGQQWFVVKYNSQGNEQWKAELTGDVIGEHTLTAVEVDADNSIYLTGQMFTQDEEQNIVTVKMDTNGNILWKKMWNGLMDGWDEPLAMKVAPQGGVYVTGWSEDTVYYNGNLYSNWNIILLHYDGAGNLNWSTRYDGSYKDEDYAYDLQVDADGNIYMVGSETTSTGGFDLLALKYNKLGNLVWKNVYGASTRSDEAYKMTLHDGLIYVTGYARWDFWEDPFLWKLDTAGNHQWIKYFGATGYGYDVKVDKSGNIYYAAAIDEVIKDDDFAVVKYSPSGQQQWTQAHDGPHGLNDGAGILAIDDQDNIIAGGWEYVSTSGATQYRATIIQYDSSGTKDWSYNTFGSSNEANVAGLMVSADGTIHAAGVEGGDDTGFYVKLQGNGTLLKKVEIKGVKSGMADMKNLLSGENGVFYLGGDFYLDTTTVAAGLVKMNSNGTEAWKVLPTDSNGTSEYFVDMAMDAAGNLLLLNLAGEFGQWEYKIYKYEMNGNLLWEKVYTGQTVALNSIATDASNNITILGGHPSLTTSILIKLNKDGTQVFSNNYDGYGYNLEMDTMGNAYMAGWKKDTNSDYYLFLMKVDANGAEIWNRTPAKGRAYNLVMDDKGNSYVCGVKEVTLTAVVVKYDSDGTLSWQYDGPYGRAIAGILDNNNHLILSMTNGFSSADRFYIQKLDDNGNLDWSNVVKFSSIPNLLYGANLLSFDKDGHLYHLGVGRRSARITKFNTSDGTRMDSVGYNGRTIFFTPTGIGSDGQGNITAAFTMQSGHRATKALRFGDPGSVGVTQLTPDVIAVYPNPAVDYIMVDTDGTEEIMIYDLTGRQVKVIRTASSIIAVNDLAAGVYLLKAGNRVGKFMKE